MEQNSDYEEEENILWNGSQGFNISNGSEPSEVFEIDSIISHDSSPDGFQYPDENNSAPSNESSNPTIPEEYYQWLQYLDNCRGNPKQIADLNSTKASAQLGSLVHFINLPDFVAILQQYYGFTEYNNELHGIFIQPAFKEFKQAHGFDEANFPFEDAGGPQKGKLAKHGYIYKYWVGKADNSYKMRKFYKENGVAIFVVFRDATSPNSSPSVSSEIKLDTEPVNKKPRVGGNSPFPNSEASSEVSSPTRLSNTQPTYNIGSNTNYYGTGSPTPTNYSQQPNVANNNNSPANPLHSPEHLSNRIDSLSDRVDDLTGRMMKVELNGSKKSVTVTTLQRRLGALVLQVLRENGGRHQLGKPLATKVRKLFGGSLDTKTVNNLLYTVLEPLGIVQLQDKEWVLIDEEKAKEFEKRE